VGDDLRTAPFDCRREDMIVTLIRQKQAINQTLIPPDPTFGNGDFNRSSEPFNPALRNVWTISRKGPHPFIMDPVRPSYMKAPVKGQL